MYISSSGNIGIGTTTPSVPLEVHTGDKTQIISDRNGNGTNIVLRRSGTNRMTLATSAVSGEEAEIFSNGDLLFNKSAGGNVGIGTTSPSEKLEVAGNLIVSESSFKGNIILTSGSAVADYNTTNFALRRGSSGQGILDAPGNILVNIDTNDNQTDAHFGITKDAGTEIFRVQEDGNVGIGTTNPQQLLHVSGGGVRISPVHGNVASLQLEDTRASYVGQIAQRSDGRISITTRTGVYGNSGSLEILDTGKIGIGTNAPTALLEVRGTGALAMFSGSSYTIEFDHAGQEKFDLHHGTSGLFFRRSNVTLAGISQDHDFAVFNQSGNRYVNFDGSQTKVRIGALCGTTAPSATLHLSGSGDTNLLVEGNITASGDISASGDLFVTGEVTLRDGNIRSDNHFDLLSLGGSAQQINVGQLGMSASYSRANAEVNNMNTTNAAMFGGDVSVGPHNNGKLGVGNLTPEYNVDILGDSPVLRIADNNNVNSLSASFIFMGENGSTEARGGGLHYDGRNNKLHIITTDNGTAIQHPSGSVKRMTILETNGRVGIGMESPGGQLGVTAVGIRAAEFTSDNDAPIMVESSDGTTGITFKDNSAEQQIYYRGNRDSFYIETPTKLGLGTNDPIETLDVRGSASFSGHITASGNISSSGTIFAAQFNDNGTNLNVPDYVFEPEYKLKTLNEVEQHISQSKHLPNIPSMDDIKAWSELSYSDRDMKLLEKIEELTLYIIHLQKQVDELKKE